MKDPHHLTGAVQMLPTPLAGNPSPGSGGNHGGMALLRAAQAWPTPRSTDGDHGGRVTPRKGREGGNLIEAVSARIWPTPNVPNGGRIRKSPNAKGGKEQVSLQTAAGGQLNPTWVEWLMGFPLGWTVLGPSETPSSRKSRKSSGGGSSK